MLNKKLKHLIFDLDDTFLKTQQGYDLINLTNAKRLQKVFRKFGIHLTLEKILEIHQKLDIQNTEKYGLSKERFPSAWRDVYYYFVTKHEIEANEVDAQALYDGAAMIFKMVLDTYGDIHSILNTLHKLDIELILLTAGDIEVQNKRIDDYDMRKYFDEIYIYPSKTPDTMREVLKNKDANVSAMVGNSLRSDIYPALEHNMFAIHIERNTWAYDNYEIDSTHNRYIKVKSLEDALNVIENLVKNEEMN